MNGINETVKKDGYINFPMYKCGNPEDLVLYKIDPITYYLMSCKEAQKYHGVNEENLFLYENRRRNTLFSSNILLPHFKKSKIETPFLEGQTIFKIPGKKGIFITTDLTHIPKEK